MLCPRSQHAMPRRRGSVLSGLFALVALLALGACDGRANPLAPAEDPLAADEPAAIEPAASDAVLAAATTQRIVFTSYRNGNQPDIYRMDPQGGSLGPVTPSATAYDAAPAWSYDNKYIAMRRLRPNGTSSFFDVYVINADGSNGRWVRPTPYPFALTDLSWSPNGARILLCVGLKGWVLATMDAATGEVRSINPALGYIEGRYPSYDPTGKKIVYLSKDLKSIRQINADGTGQKVLFSSDTWMASPTFSPDGKRIAFERVVGTGSNYEIFVKNLVTGSLQRLTYSPQWDEHPSWSPDGTRIVFSSRRSGKSQIYTMSASGGTATRITNTAVDELSPAWSH